MSWETPKMDWAATDYYNLEDAQRIAGNIYHLREMAIQIYGTEGIQGLALRGMRKQNSVDIHCYGKIGISPLSQGSDPSLYTYGTTNVLDLDSKNFVLLFKLAMLSWMPEPVYVNNYDVGYDSIDVYHYTGYCIHNDHTLYTYSLYTNPLESVVGEFSRLPVGFKNNIPLNTYWENYPQNYCMAGVSDNVYPLINAKFYSPTTLNTIETIINNVHQRFTNYIGG